MDDIRFPHLGINLHNVPDGFSLFGLHVSLYGVVIAIGFMLAFMLVSKEAKRTGQDEELYLDFALWLVIPMIIGARLYYVIFNHSIYFEKGKGFVKTFKDVINIRNGGLAIYGGIIAGIIVAIVFCIKRKANFMMMADTIAMGLLLGQAIGRWGNFFNREAFGEYTDSFFAMQIPVKYFGGATNQLVASGVITQKMSENIAMVNGEHWVSVHPTFLYECLWNIGIILIIFLYRKHKKYHGELGLMYLWGYGLGRVWIEGLRTDSLLLPFADIRVSQLLAALCVIGSSILLVYFRVKKFENVSAGPVNAKRTEIDQIEVEKAKTGKSEVKKQSVNKAKTAQSSKNESTVTSSDSKKRNNPKVEQSGSKKRPSGSKVDANSTKKPAQKKPQSDKIVKKPQK